MMSPVCLGGLQNVHIEGDMAEPSRCGVFAEREGVHVEDTMDSRCIGAIFLGRGSIEGHSALRGQVG